MKINTRDTSANICGTTDFNKSPTAYYHTTTYVRLTQESVEDGSEAVVVLSQRGEQIEQR